MPVLVRHMWGLDNQANRLVTLNTSPPSVFISGHAFHYHNLQIIVRGNYVHASAARFERDLQRARFRCVVYATTTGHAMIRIAGTAYRRPRRYYMTPNLHPVSDAWGEYDDSHFGG